MSMLLIWCLCGFLGVCIILKLELPKKSFYKALKDSLITYTDLALLIFLGGATLITSLLCLTVKLSNKKLPWIKE